MMADTNLYFEVKRDTLFLELKRGKIQSVDIDT